MSVFIASKVSLSFPSEKKKFKLNNYLKQVKLKHKNVFVNNVVNMRFDIYVCIYVHTY